MKKYKGIVFEKVKNGIVLRNFIKKEEQYKKNNPELLLEFDYPSKIFYFSFAEDVFYDLKKYYGSTTPIRLTFIKDGKSKNIIAFYDGFAKQEFSKIEKEGILYIKKEAKLQEENFKKWEQYKNIEDNKNLKYYCGKIKESYKLLRQINVVYQISSNTEKFITDKLSSLGLTDIFIGNSRYKNTVGTHEDLVKDFIKVCRLKNIEVTKITFKDIRREDVLLGKLQKCFEFGYFLYSSYGGVSLWSLEKELQYIKQYKYKIKQKIMKNILFTEEQKYWIDVSEYLSYLRDKKKEVQQKIFYYQAQCLEFIAKIIGVTRKQLEYLRANDFKPSFLKFKNQVLSTIKKNKKGYFYCITEKGKCLIVGDKSVKYCESLIKNETENIVKITGIPVLKGKVKGVVRVVFDTTSNIVFNEGDILVTGMTSTNFIPLMIKAGAIITDRGGITCHASIIVREFQKPCIIGTNIATKVLKTGDMIQIDAGKGVIYKL